MPLPASKTKSKPFRRSGFRSYTRPPVFRIRRQLWELEKRRGEHLLQWPDALVRAAKVQVQGTFLLRIDVDYLEGGIVRAAAELPIHPFDALLRIVFRVDKEIIQFA